MDKRIRPWINKKIIEYIGEPENTLVDFICSKVMAGSSPQGILDDVQMVNISRDNQWEHLFFNISVYDI
jgi:RNA-binding protein 25